MRGFFGGDERAGQAVGERAAAADLDPEGDRQVDRQAGDPRRVAEQRVERVEVIAEGLRSAPRTRRKCRRRPGKACDRGAPTVSRDDDLLDQLALAVGRKGRDDFLIIEDARSDQRLLASVAVGAKRVEVGQVGNGVDETALAEAPPAEAAGDDQQHEQRRRDVDEDEVRFEGDRQDQQGDGRAIPGSRLAPRAACASRRAQQAAKPNRKARNQPPLIGPALPSGFPRR